jgi:hypothetical protein
MAGPNKAKAAFEFTPYFSCGVNHEASAASGQSPARGRSGFATTSDETKVRGELNA